MTTHRTLAYLSIVLAAVGLVQATQPVRWTVSEQHEFLEGELRGVSVTSDGRLVRAPAFEARWDTDQAFIYAAVSDTRGTIYLGTGTGGKVLRFGSDGQKTEWAELGEPNVHALVAGPAGQIYAATGPDGKVYQLGSQGEARTFFDPDEKYIWSLVVDREGNLLVGTGPSGVIYQVSPEGQHRVFYDSKEAHITSLEWDLDGNLLAGTAPGALLIRLTPAGNPYVLFDSSLQEIKAIAVDRYGNIYAAALAASQRGQAGSAAADEGKESQANGESTVQVAGNGPGGLLEIYRIDRGNLTQVLFSSNREVAFDLLMRGNGDLLVATGNRGRILSVDQRQFVTFLAQGPEQQVTQLLEMGGKIFAATSNLGRLFELVPQPVEKGVYESKALDAGMLASWGVLSWRVTGTESPSVKFYTRVGNTELPDATWSDWSGAYSDSRGTPITSEDARFLQWKAEFEGRGSTGPAGEAVEWVTVSFLQRNMSPRLTSITVHAPGIAILPPLVPNAGGASPGGPDQAHIRSLPRAVRESEPGTTNLAPRKIYLLGAQSLSWKATDPNRDDLVYSIYYRRQEESSWKLVKKDVIDEFYTIDGVSFSDGTYLFKVVASDRVSNPSKQALENELVSKPFVIANSAPVLELGTAEVEQGHATLVFTTRTSGSVIHQAEYSVDGGEWNVIFPTDGIADSPSERYSLGVGELRSGEHAITIRVIDSVGNVGAGSTTLSIP